MTSAVDVAFRVSQLPPEIWRIVFGNFDTTDKDLTHLWFNHRRVSKLFKEEAEYVFATKFVSEASVWISHGGSLIRD